ncbi:hypothetical protein OMP38_00305 [Cohnella ginsengisoli]|uniref:Uncharacterized protein n=1 Tax=Cohnella ginsengisoli TaxID=425004 RepID=A0A9X4KCJ2_9BACL|nr:hypothetical protein [Cohnella ginsengisoli]MDG0789462.1 hypothetical protein [Cohnella ginsengisoli]
MSRKLLLLFAALLLLVPSVGEAANWDTPFVVYYDNLYKITNESVPADRLGMKLGKTSAYAETEGAYKGNFSNALPMGTVFKGILGIDVQDAIAIDSGGGAYVKAVYQESYADSKLNGTREALARLDWLWSLLIAAAAIAAFVIWRRRSKHTAGQRR